MTLEADEDEHSIEMHLSYVARVMENHPFTIVPILVGEFFLPLLMLILLSRLSNYFGPCISFF